MTSCSANSTSGTSGSMREILDITECYPCSRSTVLPMSPVAHATECPAEPGPHRRSLGPAPPIETLHYTLIADLSVLAEIIYDSARQARPVFLLDPFVVQPVVVARIDPAVPELQGDMQLVKHGVGVPRQQRVEF